MSQTTDRSPITITMLAAAVRKAVEVGLLFREDRIEEVGKNWERIKAVVEAALEADTR